MSASSSLVRLLVGVVAGLVVGTVIGWTSVASVLAAWATVAAVFVVWTWGVVGPMGPDDTASHATREEPTRFGAHVVVVAAALVTLVGVVLVLVDKEIGQLLPTVAVLTSVLASWAAIHTVFALRYARMYLTDGARGIDFHMTEPPRYTDFAYVAVTVGMSFAISDTDLGSSAMRRTALVHALLSYLFGTVIIALLVNLVASM
ncbi:DUF1345 domain-containing protein [Cellulomonas sp. Root137]|uniref:DUF1345 domain-containing protein n=1 Tax=Cellulomonas sp. Root137 TaxID=1736459 RepID=UPI0006F5A3A8|nr:DUF1345 domain-containing protein [Cellulomonas sp. Root137]KQY46962.1 hypothetical protein ASD18_06125 [Cellulomonas sp. Root137]